MSHAHFRRELATSELDSGKAEQLEPPPTCWGRSPARPHLLRAKIIVTIREHRSYCNMQV